MKVGRIEEEGGRKGGKQSGSYRKDCGAVAWRRLLSCGGVEV